jgi:hypothetical protein
VFPKSIGLTHQVGGWQRTCKLLEVTKTTFVVAPFIAINVDEVTMINNTQSLLIHLYVVQKWKHIPIVFLCVEK